MVDFSPPEIPILPEEPLTRLEGAAATNRKVDQFISILKVEEKMEEAPNLEGFEDLSPEEKAKKWENFLIYLCGLFVLPTAITGLR